MEADGKYLQDAESLKNIYLTGSGGKQIPLSQVATVSPTNTPLAVNHQASLPRARCHSISHPACRSGRQPRRLTLRSPALACPTGITASFQGGAKDLPAVVVEPATADPRGDHHHLSGARHALREPRASDHHPFHFAFSAGVGAVLALMMFKMEFSLIALIGVILLIGIVKKTRSCDDRRRYRDRTAEGLDPREAIIAPACCASARS